MTLKQVTIKKGHVPYTELKSLSELLNSNDIRNNGKVVVKCDLECEILEIRKAIKELLNVNYSDITCVYLN
jgi:hypothetical protein